jgi:hypothetical protein
MLKTSTSVDSIDIYAKNNTTNLSTFLASVFYLFYASACVWGGMCGCVCMCVGVYVGVGGCVGMCACVLAQNSFVLKSIEPKINLH